MTYRTIIAAGAALALAGCHGHAGADGNSSSNASAGATATASAPVKRQPGSWSTKIEVTRMEGPGATDQQKQMVQKIFDMVSGMSVCLTSEAAAKEDPTKNLTNSAGGRNCTFDRKEIAGSTIDLAGTCQQNGQRVKMTVTGSNGPTGEDVTVTARPLTGETKGGLMEMHVVSRRTGACKPGDVTPPPQG